MEASSNLFAALSLNQTEIPQDEQQLPSLPASACILKNEPSASNLPQSTKKFQVEQTHENSTIWSAWSPSYNFNDPGFENESD